MDKFVETQDEVMSTNGKGDCYPNPSSEDVDDQFFHVTCHIEDSLRSKIEKGEYVDLEKLLPKQREKMVSDHKLDLVYHDGHSYFIPAPIENCINGIRKWEQAFRIYATIFSQA